MTVSEMLETIHENDLFDIFPEFSRVVHILAVIPATSCSAERLFSALRRLKTYLRSTMGQMLLTRFCPMFDFAAHLHFVLRLLSLCVSFVFYFTLIIHFHLHFEFHLKSILNFTLNCISILISLKSKGHLSAI